MKILVILLPLIISCGKKDPAPPLDYSIKTEVSKDGTACFCSQGDQLYLMIPTPNATMEKCIPLCQTRIPMLKKQMESNK